MGQGEEGEGSEAGGEREGVRARFGRVGGGWGGRAGKKHSESLISDANVWAYGERRDLPAGANRTSGQPGGDTKPVQ